MPPLPSSACPLTRCVGALALAATLAAASHAQVPTLDARTLRDRSRTVAYLRSPRPAPIAEVVGLDLQDPWVVQVELAAPVGTQLRLLVVTPDGRSFVRLVALEPARPRRSLTLDLGTMDPVPDQRWDAVPAGGALLVLDEPGLRQVLPRARLELGPLEVARARPAPEGPQRPRSRRRLPDLPTARALDHLRGAWEGKAAGLELGLPREGAPGPDLEALAILEDGGDPFPAPAASFGFGPDDDLTLSVHTMLLAARLGRAPDALDLGLAWTARLPPEVHWDNAWSSMRALARGARPPDTGAGPLGTSLSARIRAGAWGLLVPAAPAAAAARARADAALTSHGLAQDEAAFVAALVSDALDLAPRPGSPARATPAALQAWLRRGLGRAGPRVRALDAAVRRQRSADASVLDALAALSPPLDATARRDLGRWAWVGSGPNLLRVLLALHYGEGDPWRSAALAALLGADADCNAGTVGELLGAWYGARGLGRLAGRVEGRVRVSIPGSEHWDLGSLASRTLEARDALASRGLEARGARARPASARPRASPP